MSKKVKCFKGCHKDLLKPKFKKFIELIFSDMNDFPLFKGKRLNDGNDNNNIKCILQYLFWNIKGKNCIPCPCDVCGKNKGIIMGHIISRDNGGTYNLQNLLWTCQSCENKIGSHNITLNHIQNKQLLKKKFQKIFLFIQEYNKNKNNFLSFNYNFGNKEIDEKLQKSILPSEEFKKKEQQRKLLENFKQVSSQGSFRKFSIQSTSKSRKKKKTSKKMWSSSKSKRSQSKSKKLQQSSTIENWDD
tara:strand:+ start:151 stop:885 length:735 start_codon:yes stop_codon:yes gene_type:complete